MARSIFYGVGAFVGSITGPTSCAFWPDDPNKLKWDPAQLVKVDLSKNPEAVRQGLAPGAVEVDDFAGYNTGGLTRIGPIFPGGITMGTLYLEDSKCAGLGANDPRKLARAYEWATVVYYDGQMAGRRFHGFHGNVVNASGNMGLVSLFPRGMSAVAGQAPFGTFWLDFPTLTHPVEPGLTGITPVKGQQGAVFIDTKASGGGGGGGVSPFDNPKSPKWAGGTVEPRGHRVR
jgi:hypothetical protein